MSEERAKTLGEWAREMAYILATAREHISAVVVRPGKQRASGDHVLRCHPPMGRRWRERGE